jgi:hypothetical protein
MKSLGDMHVVMIADVRHMQDDINHGSLDVVT